MKNYKELLRKITTFIFDYDGVFTDGSVIVIENGEALRRTNVKDGYAMQLAVKSGYNVVIISGGRGTGMQRRLEMLKTTKYYLGVSNKQKVLEEFLEEYNLSPGECLYMGDDIPDFYPMKHVALACCPADAAYEIQEISYYISHKRGGEGCVRDVIEQVLKSQNKWLCNPDAHLW
ncbi:MAG: HAD-IIIA family hydrolase [Bacteroidales bacterium]|jgi:3-deoxy-D-manno-octulosonate 8-phosphate phosphatase (KDO 8-P phosphatase)|nr:HAD-IIIA family hydrolase [Bacteroidales bacterium]